MDAVFDMLSIGQWAAAVLISLLAGTVKGMVGFAMPMIMISGLSTFVEPEIALAGLIVPTLFSNGMQSFQQGAAAVSASIVRFRIFLISGLVFLVISSQMVQVLPSGTLLLMIGCAVAFFVMLQLFRPGMRLARPTVWSDAGVGGVAGFLGGMSGVWGPPTVLYLTALGTEKREQVRIQGVIYGLGALGLVAAHTASGVLRSETLPFSVALVAPSLFGMWLGGRVQQRIDQAAFRRVTLLVLLLAGLNLVRRGLVG